MVDYKQSLKMWSSPKSLCYFIASILNVALCVHSAHLPAPNSQELRAKRSMTVLDLVLRPPSGSSPPRHGSVVRKPSSIGSSSIRLLDLTPVPVGKPLPTEHLPPLPIRRPQPVLPGSLPVVRHRDGPKKITECRRKPKFKPLTMKGCETINIDVGFCQGACRSREIPGESLQLHGDAFAFIMQQKCRTCRAEFETREILMRCGAPPQTNEPDSYVQQEQPVAIKVVKSCSCQKCVA